MKERKGGDIRKWDQDADGEGLIHTPDDPRKLRAEFVELREITSAFGESKTGYVVDLDVREEGRQTWSCPAILKSKLDGLKPGALVEIHYTGKAETSKGNDAHQFRVFELDAEEYAVPF